MTSSDVIIVITALILLTSIVVSLFIGLKSIGQTKDIQEKQYRNKLLNDIVQWAIDITECGLGKDITPLSQITDKEEIRQFVLARATELELSFKAIAGRSRYIHGITSAFGQDLQTAVSKLEEELEVHTDLFTQMRGAIIYKLGTLENISARDMMSRKVRDHKLELDKYSNKVIDEVGKIQVKRNG